MERGLNELTKEEKQSIKKRAKRLGKREEAAIEYMLRNSELKREIDDKLGKEVTMEDLLGKVFSDLENQRVICSQVIERLSEQGLLKEIWWVGHSGRMDLEESSELHLLIEGDRRPQLKRVYELTPDGYYVGYLLAKDLAQKNLNENSR